MENFIRLMNLIIEYMKNPFTIWGYTFSFWGMFMLSAILSVVFWFVSQIFND